MRFASLGSGSRGNGTLVEHGSTCLLIDCGFSVRDFERRLARLGRRPEDLAGILVTHEHSDHVGGVGAVARKYGMPVWMTLGSWCQQSTGELPALHLFNCHESFVIGDLLVEPFPVPHDAREPSQFVFGNGDRRVGLLTDTGSCTQHISRCLDGLDALVLECNHDVEMLENGDYPPSLKRRVGGRFGHLSNAQAAEILVGTDCTRLQHLVAAHISEKNNTSELARAALAGTLGCESEWIAIAEQDDGLAWRDVL